MAKFSVKYKTVINGKLPLASYTVSVEASNVWEAREAFKWNHVGDGTITYKIVGVIKIGK